MLSGPPLDQSPMRQLVRVLSEREYNASALALHGGTAAQLCEMNPAIF